jgi:hypothetical protein
MGLKNVPSDKTLTCGFVLTIAEPGQSRKGMGERNDLAGPVVVPWAVYSLDCSSGLSMARHKRLALSTVGARVNR